MEIPFCPNSPYLLQWVMIYSFGINAEFGNRSQNRSLTLKYLSNLLGTLQNISAALVLIKSTLTNTNVQYSP